MHSSPVVPVTHDHDVLSIHLVGRLLVLGVRIDDERAIHGGSKEVNMSVVPESSCHVIRDEVVQEAFVIFDGALDAVDGTVEPVLLLHVHTVPA